MSLLRSARRARFGALAGATALVSVALTTDGMPAASAAVALPHAPVALPSSIEGMPDYQPQTFCDPVDKPGPKALGALLTATYQDTSVIDISRGCTSESGTSEHKDGRALDWGANVKNAQQVKEVQTVFSWLFAKDAAGNPDAMLRRLGIMYIIWNKQIWGSWSQKWEPYSCSGVTACHQDHVHFSFDWAGAEKKTSFWTGRTVGYVAPPTYTYTSASFPQVTKVNATSSDDPTPFQVKTGLSYRFTVTGTYHYGKAATQLADAECSTTDGKTWKPLAVGDTSTMSGLYDLWVNGHRAWVPSPANASGCSSTHTYTRTLTFGATAPVHLRVSDPTHGDDSGSLKVTIQRI
jgi:hypothetical protein